jgi:hypothetical protein
MVATSVFAQNRAGRNIEYKGRPWVDNVSKANDIPAGLYGHHISIWASHGRYYDKAKARWKWQRPNLFCTTEDLFTQTITNPYVIPMLENAGAIVFMPRERDWQRQEIIVDNDDATHYYTEISGFRKWQQTKEPGFHAHQGIYSDGENPFNAGSARQIRARKRSKKKKVSYASFQPNIPREGKYAVYISYQTQKKSIDDAEFTVCHKGQETTFHVNQQMGSGTWVYLGTFDFDRGCNEFNRVLVSNRSKKNKGYVTVDAVRFGGGMGNIERGGTTSGLPRAMEGARYWAQWAGAPYSVYSHSNGANDYNDDINVRSYMTNWLSGGSIYNPSEIGKKVPLEMTLAVHSDAGIAKETPYVGSLTICSTTGNDGSTTLPSGISRTESRALANALLSNVTNDLQRTYGQWTRRDVWDRNYSETRRPAVPSAIIETLSHQNWNDIKKAQDPNFRFTLARSIYKAIARYLSSQRGKTCVIQPLAPSDFSCSVSGNKATLRWNPVLDPLESTAMPTSYNIYMATGTSDFDNGTNIKGRDCNITLEPGILYRFKITACNDGGESFPTEVLSACYQPGARKTILVINGFHRLSSPAIIDNDSIKGFSLSDDIGVSRGITAGWNGAQICFDASKAGQEGPGALGYCGDEMAGHFVMGNEFNYVGVHASAIHSAGRYNIASCSSTAIEKGIINLKDYDCVDMILGLEKNDGHSLKYYKTFSAIMQQRISQYLAGNGRMMVSGAYIASDLQDYQGQQFLNSNMKLSYVASKYGSYSGNVNGLGMQFNIYAQPNDTHYAAQHPDIVEPVGSAFAAMQYSDGGTAAVAYKGADNRTFAMSFPFECIKDKKIQNNIMKGILSFLND